VIVFNPLHLEGRKRSNIAHEIAHIALDHKVRTIEQVGDLKFLTCDLEQEEEADWLGGCLLLPRPLLVKAAFRGLGSNSAVFNLEPSVAEYIDGAYMPHARDYVAPLYDVDHIEFIKGTQSTLLGKNTSLGAISIVDRRPAKRERS